MYPRRGNSKVIPLSETHMIDVEKFIIEVKKKPIVYDYRHDMYGDRAAKTKAWNEIAAAIIDDWERMSSETRETMEKILRSKWRHIRDYFTKELKARQLTAAGSPRKRKPYAYFKNLSFLLPIIEAKKGTMTANGDTNEYKTEEVMCEGDTDSLDVTFENSPQPTVSYMNHSNGSTSNSHMIDPLSETSLGPFDTDIPEVISSHSGQRAILDEEDYEKMFLLSLLPSLRLVPENMKLQVKIDMQQVIANALHTNNTRSGLSSRRHGPRRLLQALTKFYEGQTSPHGLWFFLNLWMSSQSCPTYITFAR
ncbi:transcription factor Adf-1 isoform X2 [Diachasmimorpha longicaudata]|uniref:transcription factor Adf-1 isoform X2 n=1 Tax=Diachasmimorpha longicaudata TaxID=58733 RepID=UPI0030B91339